MKKENKLILRAMKAALKVAEAAERIRVKNDSKCGTSSAMRPGGVVSPKTDTAAEPPTGKKGGFCLWPTFEPEEPIHISCESLLDFSDSFWGALRSRSEVIQSRNERQLRAFAGDDTPHVEKLLEPLGDTPRTLVHLKSPELGTETLVVLSPEGETLLKIVKDNSRKFEVKW